MRTLKWFKIRVGKRIYRDKHECCRHCDDVALHGLIIADDFHAQYLFDTQNDFKAEGVNLNYRDKKTI